MRVARPSQCDRVLAVLKDGQWHSIDEIHQRAGTMRLNSRVAELRSRRLLDVRHSVKDGVHGYRLVGVLEPGTATPSGLPSSPVVVPASSAPQPLRASTDGLSPNESGALQLSMEVTW